MAETENNRLLTTSSNQITNITNKGSEQVQLVENASKKALDSIPSTYTELQKQVDTIESVTNSSATGIVETTHTTNGYKYLGNSTEKPIKQIVIKGNTVQNSTKGLNLINCTVKTTTINGITMVNNRDGTYTVNGTATNDFDIAIAKYTTKQNIYYTLSGCPSGGSETTYYLDPRGYKYDTGSGLTIRNPKQDFSNYIRIVIKKDVTVNNLLFKPMFNEGQTAQPFEPYTGGKPSPSPEYPQEVRGVDKILATFKGNKSTLTKSLNHTLLKPLYRLSQNVYDYIDFNRGKIIRNVGVVTFDGSSDEQWQFASNRAKIDISNMKSLIYNDGHVYFCDKFKYNKNVYSDTSTEDGFITSGVALYIRKYDEFSKMSKNADVNKYFQSNPITVYYQLSTPTEEDIPSALLTQLQALQTYYPETFINFTSTVKPFVDLEYIVDTKHLIDSLYNTINRSLGINSIDNDVVGVQINYSAGTNTRLAGAIGLTPGASFDKFKMFGGRKRCNVADDGTILAYYGDDGYKEDGSNGQVMVYQPKVYYLILPLIYDKIDDVVGGYHLRKANYYVSLAERPGFKLHPAFINENGEEVDYILKSAFEGSIYDVSAGKYLTNDEQVMDATVDKLCSVANVKPCSGFTLTNNNGYISAIGYNPNFDWLFFASESKGDSSTPVGDYLYSTPKLNDYRVALLGGRWFDGSRDGGFCLNCNDDVGTRHRAISGRLVYIPNLKNW